MPSTPPTTPNPPVITRFAPSPTGHLHIGGARTALFCWAFARKNKGHFLLRIEDTDQARSSDESARGIMEDLAWLGIDWDEGPEHTHNGRTIGGDPRGVGSFFQARRMNLYKQYLHQLVETGRAYPAFETSEELEAKRKVVVAAKQTYRYDRAAFHAIPTPSARLDAMAKADASGQPYVIRFAAPETGIVVADQVLGDVKIAPGELDDFVIRKADGFPTYHFAVVVDDQTMGITHVLRAQEHLANTPRHVALQNALGFRNPIYGHMPLIFNMDGTKMSKRDKAKFARQAAKQAIQKDATLKDTLPGRAGIDPATFAAFLAADNDSLDVAGALARTLNIALPEIEVHDFRSNGYLPEAINNFVALLGWNPGVKTADGKDLEKFHTSFLAEHFGVDRIGKTNSKFDRVKLASFNGDAIAGMTDAAFAERWRSWCMEFEPALPASLSSEQFAVLASAVKARAKTMRDAVKAAAFALRDDASEQFDAAAVEKNLKGNDGQGLTLLKAFAAKLEAINTFDTATIHAAIEAFVAEHALPNPGPVAQGVRVALAGVGVTPPLDQTLAILGKKRAMQRITTCLRVVG